MWHFRQSQTVTQWELECHMVPTPQHEEHVPLMLFVRTCMFSSKAAPPPPKKSTYLLPVSKSDAQLLLSFCFWYLHQNCFYAQVHQLLFASYAWCTSWFQTGTLENVWSLPFTYKERNRRLSGSDTFTTIGEMGHSGRRWCLVRAAINQSFKPLDSHCLWQFISVFYLCVYSFPTGTFSRHLTFSWKDKFQKMYRATDSDKVKASDDMYGTKVQFSQRHKTREVWANALLTRCYQKPAWLQGNDMITCDNNCDQSIFLHTPQTPGPFIGHCESSSLFRLRCVPFNSIRCNYLNYSLIKLL